MTAKTKKRAAYALPDLVREATNGFVSEYYPLGEYVVIQPGVQAGLPTIKHTRITAGVLAAAVAQGRSAQEVALDFRIPIEAVEEAVKLASLYDYERSYA